MGSRSGKRWKKKTHSSLFLFYLRKNISGDCPRKRAGPSRRGALWRRKQRRRRGERRRRGSAAAQERLNCCCWWSSTAAVDLGAQGRGECCPLRCCCLQLHPRLRGGERRGAPAARCAFDSSSAGPASCSSSADGKRRARPELFRGALTVSEARLRKKL